MKFVIVLIFLLDIPLTTIGPVKGLTRTLNRVKVTTVDIILFDTLKPCLTNILTVRLRALYLIF